MTNVERLAMQMELSNDSRRRLALEFVRLRALEAECRRHQRRLPHQVQSALRIEAREFDIDPPAEGMPGLFSQGRTA